ncbi:MAG: hypothetical protein R3F07_05885 [Opitutaceae bacterium]
MIKGLDKGFSLIEVALAVGVMALGMVAVVALIVPSAGRGVEVSDAATAARLVEGINQELRRIGFEEVRDAVVGSGGGENNLIWLVATKDGSRILRSGRTPGEASPQDWDAENSLAETITPGIAQRDRYFLIGLSRLTTVATDPLYYTTARGFLALKVMVTWPYMVPNDEGDYDGVTNWNDPKVAGVEADEKQRTSLLLTASVRR